MSILVVGSVAFDSIETPHGRVDHVLGGAATFFALSASYFTDVRVIGVVGEDFSPENEAVLTRRGIDTRGLEHVEGKSFHWTGSYLKNLNEAQTLKTELNVFETFAPKIPAAYEDSDFLFLANIDPVLQANVRRQMPNVKMVCGDTMNYWIHDHRENLDKVLLGLDALLINDGEAKMLAGDNNLRRAAEKILSTGPKSLVIKHGEYGATAFFSERSFSGDQVRRKMEATRLLSGDSVSRTGVAAGFGRRSDRSGGLVCGGILWLPGIAAGDNPFRFQAGHVLRRRDGFFRLREIWHRTPATTKPRRDRSAVLSHSRDVAP